MIKILLVLLSLTSFLSAKEFKAVFDCSSDNSAYILSRMFLIGRTIDMIKDDGNRVKFAITIHGGCAPIVSKNFDEIITDEDDLRNLQIAQTQLKKLATKKGVEVIVCAISLNANTIEKEDVVKYVKISKNSYIDTISFQNDGYAIMTFK